MHTVVVTSDGALPIPSAIAQSLRRKRTRDVVPSTEQSNATAALSVMFRLMPAPGARRHVATESRSQ